MRRFLLSIIAVVVVLSVAAQETKKHRMKQYRIEYRSSSKVEIGGLQERRTLEDVQKVYEADEIPR